MAFEGIPGSGNKPPGAQKPPGSGGTTGPAYGSERIQPIGSGWIARQIWNGSTWVTIETLRDYSAQDASYGGGGGSYTPGFGETQSGFMLTLGQREKELQASIDATKQRLEEIKLEQQFASGQLTQRLQAEKDMLSQQLTFQREQLAETQRQWNSEFELQQTLGLGQLDLAKQKFGLEQTLGLGQLDLAQKQFGLMEQESAQNYQISLAKLDLEGQSLAIQARSAELQAQIAQGQLSVQQAKLQLDKEIAAGELQIKKETLAQNKYIFEKNFSLQQELGRAEIELGKRQAAVQEGQLALNKEELALKGELGRAAEERLRNALYVEQFGRDPLRQALLSLKMQGGTTPQEEVFRSQGLQTGGGQLRALGTPAEQAAAQQVAAAGASTPAARLPVAGRTTPVAVPVGESGPEIAIPRRGGVEILPVTRGMREGGFIRTQPEPDPGITATPQQPRTTVLGVNRVAPTSETTNITATPTRRGTVAATPTANVNVGGRTTTPTTTTTSTGRGGGANGIGGATAAPEPTPGSLSARALEIALGLPEGSLTINASTGITGLQSPQQAALKYLQGGLPVKNLIESAYGVGGAAGGVDPAEFQRLVLDVTPRGSLGY